MVLIVDSECTICNQNLKKYPGGHAPGPPSFVDSQLESTDLATFRSHPHHKIISVIGAPLSIKARSAHDVHVKLW